MDGVVPLALAFQVGLLDAAALVAMTYQEG